MRRWTESIQKTVAEMACQMTPAKLQQLMDVASAMTPGKRESTKIDDDRFAGQCVWLAGDKVVGPDQYFTINPHSHPELSWANNEGDDKFFETFDRATVMLLLEALRDADDYLKSIHSFSDTPQALIAGEGLRKLNAKLEGVKI